MNKTRLVVFFAVGLIVGLSPASLRGGRVVAEEGNAATHYLKAFEVLQYPQSEGLKDQVQVVIANGWQEADEELERLLAEHEASFREFQNGVSLKRCDFHLGRQYTNVDDKPDAVALHLVDIRDMLYLRLLKARRLEQDGDYAGAIDVYLSTLEYAQHIAQEGTVVAIMTAIAIEEMTTTPMEEYVLSDKAEKAQCETIAGILHDYVGGRFLVPDFMQVDPESYGRGLEKYQRALRGLERIRSLATSKVEQGS